MAKKRKKKPPRKILENKLDKLWAEAVKIEAGYRCERCGAKAGEVQLHSHHIYSRRHKSTRWNLGNGLALCAFHHNWGGFHADDYKIQTEANDWLAGYFLAYRSDCYGTLEELGQFAHSTIKWSIEELEEKLTDLKKVVG